ncbi:MAG: hypothetical protein ACOX88_00155 [Christensenellales bacterium]|jgi:hypothetical protein
MKKMLCLACICVLLFLPASCAPEEPPKDVAFDPEMTDFQRYELSRIAFHRLMLTFSYEEGWENYREKYLAWAAERYVSYQPLYHPEYYHSAYPNIDGRLVILVYDDSQENVEELKEMARWDGILVRRKREYTQEELSDISRQISENGYQLGVPFGFSTLKNDNCILVELETLNLDVIRDFREKVVDTDAVRFVCRPYKVVLGES